MLISLHRIKIDKKTNKEEFIPFNVFLDEILCTYKDSKGNFILTKNGYLSKIKEDLKNVNFLLRL